MHAVRADQICTAHQLYVRNRAALNERAREPKSGTEEGGDGSPAI